MSEWWGSHKEPWEPPQRVGVNDISIRKKIGTAPFKELRLAGKKEENHIQGLRQQMCDGGGKEEAWWGADTRPPNPTCQDQSPAERGVSQGKPSGVWFWYVTPSRVNSNRVSLCFHTLVQTLKCIKIFLAKNSSLSFNSRRKASMFQIKVQDLKKEKGTTLGRNAWRRTSHRQRGKGAPKPGLGKGTWRNANQRTPREDRLCPAPHPPKQGSTQILYKVASAFTNR